MRALLTNGKSQTPIQSCNSPSSASRRRSSCALIMILLLLYLPLDMPCYVYEYLYINNYLLHVVVYIKKHENYNKNLSTIKFIHKMRLWLCWLLFPVAAAAASIFACSTHCRVSIRLFRIVNKEWKQVRISYFSLSFFAFRWQHTLNWAFDSVLSVRFYCTHKRMLSRS